MNGPSSSDVRNRVLEATNLVELIGQTVKLKRFGSKYKGLCPFHQEKTPSFTVDPTKQYFYCFGCKASGTAIDFVMKRDRLEFPEALQLLAAQAGIELPRFGGAKQSSASERQVLLDAHSAACVFFEKSLAHPQLGSAAREYLAGRGFTAETIQKFQIGLAQDSWDALLKSPLMKRFTPQQLALAGLAKIRESGGYYDTFRNRIMFPIRDVQGRIIAFGGRVVPGSQDPAKYLNSPETPLFNKSACIFGLDLSRQRIVETKTVAVVEGYTDVIMAHQYGASNVVSPLGTALTEQHVGLLRRFADRIVLLFDADTAGDLAVDRAVELLLTQQIDIAIAAMPAGVDPDEYLIANGVESFEQLLATAQDVLSYKWKQLLHQFGASDDLTSQQKAIEQYLELLGSARGTSSIDPLRWGAILTRVSRLTDIPTNELNRRFRVPRRRGVPASKAVGTAASVQAATGNGSAQASAAPAVAARGPLNSRDRAERWLLGVLLARPAQWVQVQQSIQPPDFTEPNRRKLAEIFWNFQRDEGEPTFSQFLGILTDPELKELAVSLMDEVETMSDLDQMLSESIVHLADIRRQQDERKLMAELKRVSAADESGKSPSDEVDLLRQLQERARTPDMRRATT